MRQVLLSFCVIAALCPVSVWAQDSGADAFADRDFAAAKDRWEIEAEAGSTEAMLGLGLLADRGFGQPRDLDLAFDWYQRAAELGLAEAQFNIAIMHDAGIGRSRDPAQAQLWYTRAALRDHTRAQYNLGLLLEAGDGVAANPALAAHWFAQAAATLPAAADKAQSGFADVEAIGPPDIAFASATGRDVELVWNSTSDTVTNFLVEAVRIPSVDDNYDRPLTAQTTAASGFLDKDIDAGNTVWRVSNLSVDNLDYAPSRWVAPQGVKPPKGRVTFIVDPDTDGMAAAASVFADQLRSAGYWVRLDRDRPDAIDGFYISYGYAADQPFADDIARYLPTNGTILPMKQVRGGTLPGEIFVNLSALK